MMLVIIAGTLAQIAQIILSVRLWAKRTLLCKEKQKFVTLAAIYLCPLTAGVLCALLDRRLRGPNENLVAHEWLGMGALLPIVAFFSLLDYLDLLGRVLFQVA